MVKLILWRSLLGVAIGHLIVFSLHAQTYRFSCPAYGGGYLPVRWSPMYAAYIPGDHIQGPSTCSHPLLGSAPLRNNSGKGDKIDMHADLTTSGTTQQNGNVRFYGTGSNPLESSLARVAWDIRVLMNGNNPTDARVTDVNYNHTCFPAHIIKVQRFTVYYWGPPRADPVYIFGCLVLQQGKIIGQAQPNKKVPCD